MGNISSSINLAGLNHQLMVKGEEEYIIIPLKKNKLTKGKKGGVYLNLIGFPFENKNADSKDTHLVKQSFSKEEREKMTEEEQKAYPLLGNHSVWGQSEPTEAVNTITPETGGIAEGDLPF